MVKYHVLHVPNALWGALNEEAAALPGIKTSVHALNKLRNTGSSPFNPPKQGSAAKEIKKISPAGRTGKRFLEHSEAGHTGWMYKEDDVVKYTYFFNYMNDLRLQERYGTLFRNNKDFSISEEDMALATCFYHDYRVYRAEKRVYYNQPNPEADARRAEQERVLEQEKAKHEAEMDRIQANTKEVPRETT